MSDGRQKRLSRLRELFREPSDPYMGIDMENATLMGGVFWALGGLGGALLLAFFPPTRQIGWPGWIIAAFAVLLCFAIAKRRLGGRHTLSLNEIYLSGWLGLAAICVLEWLAGGRSSPYHELYVLPALYAGSTHGWRRTLAFLGAVMLAASLPLIYGPFSGDEAIDIAAQLFMLFALAMTARAMIIAIRSGRGRLRRANEEAEALARRDPLTGLGNRLAFQEAIALEVARAGRSAKPLSLLIGDVQSFKQVNDVFGHLSGDRCLVKIAQTIAESARSADQCFRWGGDEFVLVFAETSEKEAKLAGERLSASIARNCKAPHGGSMRLNFAAVSLHEGQGTEELLTQADEALTRSSASSRSPIAPALS